MLCTQGSRTYTYIYRAVNPSVDLSYKYGRTDPAEKYVEFGKDLYVCYIDFRKAFDSVWRDGLWSVMRHLGYQEKIVRILEDLYSETLSAVRVNGGITEWFATLVCIIAITVQHISGSCTCQGTSIPGHRRCDQWLQTEQPALRR